MSARSTRVTDAGADNELRLRRRLWSDPSALRAVRELGLTETTARRFRLGLKEPHLSRPTGVVTERALAFPVLEADGTRSGRWSYWNLDGVTTHPQHPLGWGPGASRTCYSRPVTPGSTLLVVPDVVDLWLVCQAVGEAYGSLVIVAPSQPGIVPGEWRGPRMWRGWREVVLGLSHRLDDADMAGVIGRAADREIRRTAPPSDERWADLVRMGGSAAEIRRLVRDAPAWIPDAPAAVDPARDCVGDFEADPVAIEGALLNGRMHYPVTVERREVDGDDANGAVLVQRYLTRVLRSDGVLLDVEMLPAPRGTPSGGRVLALSDGTRILSAPTPTRFGTWRFASISRFIEARGAKREPDRRPLPRLVADVEAQLRSCVWLPCEEDFALAALFVVATFVHRLFDAMPILLINGAKGTGKSELGQAIANLACNGVLAGRITPAGLVRLLAESRGTVVLDDMESIGAARAAGDVVQILKTSYKAATARRVSPGRDGRIEVMDFFAPKVVTNISGADPVLLSRMLAVRTGPMPAEFEPDGGVRDVAALRDELHTWAMCEAPLVAEAYATFRDAARDRRAEISAPLRAVASLARLPAVTQRLERALAAAPEPVAEPIDTVLVRVLHRLVEEGATEVAMPRLMLEVALASAGRSPLPSAESLGRSLIGIGAREAGGAVERRRLHGEVVRVYRLADTFVERHRSPGVGSLDPFAFCLDACSRCCYEAVCRDAVPGLHAARSARHGSD